MEQDSEKKIKSSLTLTKNGETQCKNVKNINKLYKFIKPVAVKKMISLWLLLITAVTAGAGESTIRQEVKAMAGGAVTLR